MNNSDFNSSVASTMQLVESMLISKGEEYAPNADRLHNFNVASQFKGETRESALWGMATKHFVSISDMVKATETTGDLFLYSEEKWTEKVMDAINYLYLLRAVRLDNQLQNKDKCIGTNVPVEPRPR